jgi:hypothetical protein
MRKFLDQIDHLQQGDRQADWDVIYAQGMEISCSTHRDFSAEAASAAG